MNLSEWFGATFFFVSVRIFPLVNFFTTFYCHNFIWKQRSEEIVPTRYQYFSAIKVLFTLRKCIVYDDVDITATENEHFVCAVSGWRHDSIPANIYESSCVCENILNKRWLKKEVAARNLASIRRAANFLCFDSNLGVIHNIAFCKMRMTYCEWRPER